MTMKQKTLKRKLTFNELLVVAQLYAAQFPATSSTNEQKAEEAVKRFLVLKNMEYQFPADDDAE